MVTPFFRNIAKPLPIGHRPNILIKATKPPPPPIEAFKPNVEGLRQNLMESIRINGSGKDLDQYINKLPPQERAALLAGVQADPGNNPENSFVISTDPRTDEQEATKAPASPLPYKDTNRNFWKAALEDDNRTFADYEPHRIVVAWRLLREMARRKKQVALDQSLPEGITQTAPDDNPDPWTYPSLLSKAARTVSYPYSSSVFMEICLEAERLEPQEAVCDTMHQMPRLGIGYLPPEPAPCHYITKHPEPPPQPPPATAMKALAALSYEPPPPPPPEVLLDPLYDPGKDKQLGLYCRALQQVARDLHVVEGSTLEPDYGMRGMQGLFDPRFVRLVFPTRTQICTFELLLTERTCNQIVQKNVPKARLALREEFGLTVIEIEQVMAMARRFAESVISTNTKSNRAMIALRLEDYIQRSKDSLDLNNEIKGLKLLSIVQEVAKTEAINNVMTEVDIKVLASKVKSFDFNQLKAALSAPNGDELLQLPAASAPAAVE